MSVFGSFGLAKLPFTPWLLPMLLGCMVLYWFMLWRSAPRIGWWPLGLHIVGTISIATVRLAEISNTGMLLIGVSLIVAGTFVGRRTDSAKPLPAPVPPSDPTCKLNR